MRTVDERFHESHESVRLPHLACLSHTIERTTEDIGVPRPRWRPPSYPVSKVGQLDGDWTWKAEYLYLYLGSESGSLADNFGGIASWNAKSSDSVVRVGLDCKFSN